MADVDTQVTRYQYEYRAAPDENIALVYLFDAERRTVAMLVFVDGDEPLPAPRQALDGLVILAYRRRDMGGMVDMLRHEKPLQFTWVQDTRIARLTTGKEPMGEGEFRGLWSQLFG